MRRLTRMARREQVNHLGVQIYSAAWKKGVQISHNDATKIARGLLDDDDPQAVIPQLRRTEKALDEAVSHASYVAQMAVNY